MFKFELNEIVKDIVTGFTGVILGRTEYSTGCIQYGVQAMKLTKEGVLPKWEWFDETRLQHINKSISFKKEKQTRKVPGGPAAQAPSVN